MWYFILQRMYFHMSSLFRRIAWRLSSKKISPSVQMLINTLFTSCILMHGQSFMSKPRINMGGNYSRLENWEHDSLGANIVMSNTVRNLEKLFVPSRQVPHGQKLNLFLEIKKSCHFEHPRFRRCIHTYN